MKAIKVFDDLHRRVKVEAAESGRTTPVVASLLLRHALDMLNSGKIQLSKLEVKSAQAVSSSQKEGDAR